MKNLSICFILLFLMLSSLFGQGYIQIDGVDYQADTLAYRQVGPGTIYSQFNIPGISLNVYILEVDVNNEYNTIETFQANDQVSKTEAMTKAYDRLSTEEQQALGSINGNFWVVANQGKDELMGVPHGGSARLGEMITELDPWNRPHGTTPEELLIDMGFAVIDEENKVWVDDMGFDGKVTISGGSEFNISQINRLRGSNQLVFFNSYIGSKTKTNDDGTEVFIKPIEGDRWKVNENVKCEVTRIIKDTGSNELQEGESVLSGDGAAKEFLNQLNEGDMVEVYMGVYTLMDQYRPMVKEMISGNALIMKDGVLTNRNYNEPYNMNLYARTAVGVSEDSKTAYLIVIANRGTSKGATTATLCHILKSAGAVSAVSLDGGGSAQMMIGGKIVGQSSDGAERAVANGWMVFSTASEKDETPARLAFEDYQVNLPCYSSYQPNILVYNKYGVLIEEITQGYTLQCEEHLGYIKNNNLFVANNTVSEGLLTVNYQDISVSKKYS